MKLLISISEQAVKFIDMCTRTVHCLSLMPVDKYKEVTTKMMAFNKLSLVTQFIEKLLDLLKEGALVPKFDITVFV